MLAWLASPSAPQPPDVANLATLLGVPVGPISGRLGPVGGTLPLAAVHQAFAPPTRRVPTLAEPDAVRVRVAGGTAVLDLEQVRCEIRALALTAQEAFVLQMTQAGPLHHVLTGAITSIFSR